jgi:hypothetical protein
MISRHILLICLYRTPRPSRTQRYRSPPPFPPLPGYPLYILANSILKVPKLTWYQVFEHIRCYPAPRTELSALSTRLPPSSGFSVPTFGRLLEVGKMSVLPVDVHNELSQLLDALQSADNSVRSQAEEHLANNWTTSRPEMLLMGLVEQISGSNDPTVGYSSSNSPT